MKFLLDTNVLIPAEPTSIDNIEEKTPIIARFLGLAAAGRHTSYIHPASILELQGDQNQVRRDIRLILLKKYPVLEHPPEISRAVISLSTTGSTRTDRHNQIDLLFLSAVEADAVDYLITDDLGIHQKAKKIGLQERVICSVDSIAVLEALFPFQILPPPAVQGVPAYALDTNDPIFQSFRSDYPDFDAWLVKCKKEHRQTWTIKTCEDNYLRGFCIVNEEKNLEYNIPQPTLKICSFKISESSRGGRLGELLLKPVFDYAKTNSYASIFVETYDKQVELVNMLMNLGFEKLEESSAKGELILFKRMFFEENERKAMPPLDFHIKFGPQIANFEDVRAFIVPINPKYHEILMPEIEEQMNLLPGSYASGNGIRKAYLCNAITRQISVGNLVFFYRSSGGGKLSSYGIVENAVVSTNPLHIAQAVGTRTVYNFSEIEIMCKSEVLAILFRLVGLPCEDISLKSLIQADVLKSAPQSIVGLSETSKSWLKSKFAT
jgi:hypothetical protein